MSLKNIFAISLLLAANAANADNDLAEKYNQKCSKQYISRDPSVSVQNVYLEYYIVQVPISSENQKKDPWMLWPSNIDPYLTYMNKIKTEKPIAVCRQIVTYREYGASSSSAFTCANNYTKNTFDITDGFAPSFDRFGSETGKVPCGSDYNCVQDKSGNKLAISGDFGAVVYKLLSPSFSYSGMGGVYKKFLALVDGKWLGDMYLFHSLPITKNTKMGDVQLIYKASINGFHCSYRSPPKFQF